MKKKTIVVIIVVSILALIIISIPVSKLIIREVDYNTAIEYVINGDYEQAISALDELGDYKHCDAVSNYCSARIYYNQGNYDTAHFKMLSTYGQYIYADDRLIDAITEFNEDLNKKYDEQLKADKERKTEEEKQKAQNGIPYVGMNENYISITKLGDWDDYDTKFQIVNGEREEYGVYSWYAKDGALILEVKVEHNRVTDVTKFNEGRYWLGDDLIINFSGNSLTKTTSKSNSKKDTTTKYEEKEDEEEDKYNVNDYSNEEDFYYDHYDDFFDYYDAEDYYREHHD